MHSRTWIIFLGLLKVFLNSRKCSLKKERTKISAKSCGFVSSNHFENGLNSDMSEQGSLDRWLETNYISKSSICNLWHQSIFKDGKIFYSSFLFRLHSPNLDVNDEFVRSRSGYSLKNGKTIRAPHVMEPFYIETTSFSDVHHVYFPIHFTEKQYFHSVTRVIWRRKNIEFTHAVRQCELAFHKGT